MSPRSSAAILGLMALWPGGSVLDGPGAPDPAATTAQDSVPPVRLVVENRSYSTLQISVRDAEGRERRLGQAPPEFTNTLFITAPLPEGRARLVARLPGETEELYVSAPMRLEAGRRIRWRLPENAVDR